jgi:hypothetical protein
MLASVNDLRPEMGVTRPCAAAPSFISTSVGDLFSGLYPNPNPKRDPDLTTRLLTSVAVCAVRWR